MWATSRAMKSDTSKVCRPAVGLVRRVGDHSRSPRRLRAAPTTPDNGHRCAPGARGPRRRPGPATASCNSAPASTRRGNPRSAPARSPPPARRSRGGAPPPRRPQPASDHARARSRPRSGRGSARSGPSALGAAVMLSVGASGTRQTAQGTRAAPASPGRGGWRTQSTRRPDPSARGLAPRLRHV